MDDEGWDSITIAGRDVFFGARLTCEVLGGQMAIWFHKQMKGKSCPLVCH
jgi:hypothetical protein